MAWSLKNFACMVSIFIFLEFIFYNIHNICKSKHLNMEIFLYIFWNFYILSLGCYKLKKNTLMKIPGKRADLCQCVCVCVCVHAFVCCVYLCVYTCLRFTYFVVELFKVCSLPSMKTCIPASCSAQFFCVVCFFLHLKIIWEKQKQKIWFGLKNLFSISL